jgi:predicted nucleotidyltransferase
VVGAYTAPVPVTAAETAAFLRQRRNGIDAEIARRSTWVQARLPAVAAVLRSDFGATEVWLFGSHQSGRLHPESDVDLAVAGVSAATIDRAHAELETLLEGVVDLVQLETASPSLRQRIGAEGRAL